MCAFSEKPPYHDKVAHPRGIFMSHFLHLIICDQIRSMEVIDKWIEFADVCFWWEAPLPQQGSTHKGDFLFSFSYFDILWSKNISIEVITQLTEWVDVCFLWEAPLPRQGSTHKGDFFLYCVRLWENIA